MALRDSRRRSALKSDLPTQGWTLPSALHIILAITLVVAVLQLGFGWAVTADTAGAVVPDGGVSVVALSSGRVWTLFTTLFVHESLGHAFVNLFFVAYYGRVLLSLLGTAAFLKIYLGGGIVGAALQMALAALLKQDVVTPVWGASAAACALIAAVGTLLPEDEMSEWFYSIIPIRLSQRRLAIFLAILNLALAVLPLLFGWADELWGRSAVYAHLGGMAVGWYVVKLLGLGDRPLTYSTLIAARRWNEDVPPARPLSRVSHKARLEAVRPEMDETAILLEKRSPLKPSKPVVQDVDSILDKIALDGINSLSDDERRQLEAASRDLAARERR
jgi:membrane associated rhomboid family serine protease